MVKHILSVFEHFVGLALKELISTQLHALPNAISRKKE